jgi:sulfite reductase (NADPH) flavoprotein alpha-component
MPGQPLLPKSAPFTSDQITALNSIMAAFTTEQRSWLSGFLAGYQAGQGTAVAAPPATQAKIPLTILYATESGNSEGVAADAKKAAAKLGFAASILDMAEADLKTVAKAANLLVIASTWGEGDPPERAVEFYNALMAETAPRFDDVRFAVLALGDTAYANFCAVGRQLDARLEALGGQRITGRIDCDVAYEAPAATWLKGTLDQIKELAKDDAVPASSVIHVDFAMAAPAESPYGKANPFPAEITDHVNLNGSRSAKETIHLELSLAGSGMTYEPGDAMGVLASNHPAMVESILKVTGLDGDDSLHDLLSHQYDVTTLTPPVIEAYAQLTGEAGVRKLLEGEGLEGKGLAEWLEGRQIIDLLEAFPHRLTAEQLMGILRPMPPRLYSIASSLKYAPEEAHLLVGVLRYQSHGRDRRGVASTCLAENRAVGDTLPVYIKPNRHFRLPSDPDTPIIMIGPGTGVAPFRAFIQEREALGIQGRSWLFFGDRNYTQDFLYQLEWQDHLKSGALGRIDVAFSRDQPEKSYVQHQMWDRRAELHSWLKDGGHVYVCGDEKRMAKDVHSMLQRIVAECGGLDAGAAEAYLTDLRRQGRYQRDVY